MELSWKVRNLSLCRKIFEHSHFVQNFPPVPEMLSKIQTQPFPALGYNGGVGGGQKDKLSFLRAP